MKFIRGNNSFLLLSVLICFTTFGQETDNLTSLNVENYKLPREKFHINTDREQYYVSDTIRFSVFIINHKTNLPFNTTANVYCGLYDSSGKEVYRGIFRAKNGIATGNFKFNDFLPEGKYYLHASTNWSQNFSEDSFSLKQIEVVPKQQEKNDPFSAIRIRLTAEGGNYLVNTTNSIAFEVRDASGEGIANSNAKVYDADQNILLSNIKTDQHGIGKFNLRMEKDEGYELVLELPDSLRLNTKIPKADRLGLSLQLNNYEDDKIVFNVKTNKNTLPTLKGKTYYWAIFKDGNIAMQELFVEDLDNIIVISKEQIPKGLNKLTILDETKEKILERLFFNDHNYEGLLPLEHTVSTDLDSIKLNINLPEQFKKAAHFTVRIRNRTDESKPKNNGINNGFLIQNYLKSPSDHPNYLNDLDNSNKYAFDNFLILQGSGKINFEEQIQKREHRFSFAQGFEIRGKLIGENKDDIDKIFVYKDSVKNVQFAELRANKTFTFSNQNIKREDILHFGGLNFKGENIKPQIDVEIRPITTSQQLVIPQDQTKAITTMVRDNPTALDEGVTVLETVEIKAKVKDEYDGDLPNGYFTAKKVSDEDIKKYRTLEYYVRRAGFKTRLNSIDNTFTILPKIRIMEAPVVIVNGFKSSNKMQNYMLHNIDEISYEHTGLSGSNGGTIYINIGRYREAESIDKKVMVFKTDVGYENSIAEYTLDPANFKPDRINGLVYWNGNLRLDANSNKTIKLPNLSYTDLWVTLDGITLDGKFISYAFKVEDK